MGFGKKLASIKDKAQVVTGTEDATGTTESSTTEGTATEGTIVAPVTTVPTDTPTDATTMAPSGAPTEMSADAQTAPVDASSETPAEPPMEAPTEAVTEPPTEAATEPPTEAATEPPTEAATEPPTEAVTEPPTEAMTEAMTEAVTMGPTEQVTASVPPAERSTEPTEMEPTQSQMEADPVTTMPMTEMLTTEAITVSSMPGKKKKRDVSKPDTAKQFVYGREEKPWVPRRRKNLMIPVKYKANRAQLCRKSYNLKRVAEVGEMRARRENREKEWRNNLIVEPIVVRAIPAGIHSEPDIDVRNNRTSQFRFLFNRRPVNVRVQFKKVKTDAQRPPFVVPRHLKIMDEDIKLPSLEEPKKITPSMPPPMMET